MATRAPIANCYRCTFDWSGPSGRSARNVFYVMSSKPCSQNDAASLANILLQEGNSGNPSIISLITAIWSLPVVTVTAADGSEIQAVSTATGETGGASGSSYAPSTAVCISWVVGASYRGGKPRWYLPGIPVAATTVEGGSQLTPTYQASVANAGNSYLTAINGQTLGDGSTLQLGTVSYVRNKAPRTPPVFLPFTAARCHTRLDSQRRRSGKETN